MLNFICDFVDKLGENECVKMGGVVLVFYIVWKVLKLREKKVEAKWTNLFRLIQWNLVYFKSCKFDFNHHADGGYAVITGGADGIGKACANLLAQRGINLYLMDINTTLLQKTVNDLQVKYPKISVKSKVMDLTKLKDEKVFNELEEEISELKIGILFNNAGIAEYKPWRFVENSHKDITMWELSSERECRKLTYVILI